MSQQYGLVWKSRLVGWEPRWTVEPSITAIESIARRHLEIAPNASCWIKFLSQGAFNKLYTITTAAGSFIIRISLPVDPYNKTASEVATINFIRKHTTIPVAQIYAYDVSGDNKLKFEWILMELLPGKSLWLQWRKLSMNAKTILVKEIAKYQAQFFRHKFHGIGNLSTDSVSQDSISSLSQLNSLSRIQQSPPVSNPEILELRQMVSLVLFLGDHLHKDVPRGPFFDSQA